jgi:outer membrane protein assembly factor BamB
MLQLRWSAVWTAILLGPLVDPASARAEDWPMYRFDEGRTAASPEELPATLHVQWIRQLPALKPAWPDQPKMQLDAVYEPVVLGKLLFVGSSHDDTLTAYDTATGNRVWRFYAEGPIRYAPAASQGKLYVASDDGYLYCLDAAKGTVLWRFRGGPNDRRILGNERLISTWPARGAPVVAEGKVYFAASIWPFMGIFIHCLDADTGKVVWTNDGDGSVYMKQPHNTDAFAGVAPQGPMVLRGDNLLVPGGRSIPAVFDRKTGKSLRYQLAENGKKGGGAMVAAVGNYFANGSALFQLDNEKYLGPLGDLAALTPDVGYGWTKDTLRAWDLKNASFITEETVDKKGEKKKVTKWKMEELAAVKVDQVEALIKAGNHLYLARPGEVQAWKLPLTADATPSWKTAVEGTPASLIAADGRLFVVTREGKLYCFGGDKVDKQVAFAESPPRPALAAKAVQKAQELLKTYPVTEGYAVLYGAGAGEDEGHLASALALETQLRVIVVEPDAERAHRVRDLFKALGLPCARATVYVGRPETFELPPYLASLVYCEDPAAVRLELNSAFLQRVAGNVRPFGGVAWFPVELSSKQQDALLPLRLPGVDVVISGKGVVLQRRGAPPGAGNWTHEHGDAANTRVAKDQIVKAPLGLLWFGGPSHEGILPRHGHGPQPQVIDGRCFIEGVDMIRAIDIYTGRLLWESQLPGVGFFYNNLLHQPGANSTGGNFVCTHDGIYVVLGASCVKLDPATGKKTQEFRLPAMGGAKDTPRWGYLNVEGPYLVGGADPLFDEKLFKDAVIAKDDKGITDDSSDKTKKPDDAITKFLKNIRANNDNFSSSKHLVIMDRNTGKVLWTASARHGFRHNAICIGGDRIYCIDRLSGPELSRLKRRGEKPASPSRLVVFDLKTGKELWSTEDEVFGTWLSYSTKYDILVEAGRMARDTIIDEPWGMRAYDAATGKVRWNDDDYAGPAMIHESDHTIFTGLRACDLLTGEMKMRPHPLTGIPVPWEWARNYGCNTPAASEFLMTFRSGAAGYLDLCNDGGTGNLGGFRSSCTNNLIVAGGVLTAPDYTRTCSCLYQNQTSIGLIHMPEAEIWTSFGTLKLNGVVQRVGISLGAPGDRRADNGTLWLEYPSVGGKSPEVHVKVAGSKLEWFRHHSSKIEGPMNWVAASGVKGLSEVSLKLSNGTLEARNYTVRLYFAEPDDLEAGKRVFNVAIQGHEALKDFDIVKESGGRNRTLVREFTGISATDQLSVTFRAATKDAAPPLLCGIEIVAEEPARK